MIMFSLTMPDSFFAFGPNLKKKKFLSLIFFLSTASHAHRKVSRGDSGSVLSVHRGFSTGLDVQFTQRPVVQGTLFLPLKSSQ